MECKKMQTKNPAVARIAVLVISDL